MGGRSHEVECEKCGQETGGLNDVRCLCDEVTAELTDWTGSPYRWRNDRIDEVTDEIIKLAARAKAKAINDQPFCTLCSTYHKLDAHVVHDFEYLWYCPRGHLSKLAIDIEPWCSVCGYAMPNDGEQYLGIARGDRGWETRDLKDVLPHQFPYRRTDNPKPLLTFEELIGCSDRHGPPCQKCHWCIDNQRKDKEWMKQMKQVFERTESPPFEGFEAQSGDVAGFKEGTFWKISEAGVFAPTDDPRRFYFEGWVEKPETVEILWLGAPLEVIPVSLIQEDEEVPVEICGAPPPGAHPEVAPCILAKRHEDLHVSGEGYERFQWPTPPRYKTPKTSYYGDGGSATYPCGCEANWVMAYGNTCARKCREWHSCSDCTKYGHII